MIALLLALSVTVEPAFGLECRPPWNAGPTVVEASNDAEPRRVAVEMADVHGHIAELELDLPTRSHKRLLVMPPLGGRVTQTLIAEDGTRTPLPYPQRRECGGPTIAALLRDDGRAGFAIPSDISGTPIEAGAFGREDLAPTTWRPLMALDAIAAEARALHELSDAEFAVLEQWTRSGGVLVVVPGVDPAPFFASGRLPQGVRASAEWQSAPWGAGAVAITDPVAQDARLASLILVNIGKRETWGKGIARLFEVQRDRSGPSGRASQPTGILALGVVLLVAALAHELLRRRFVVASRDFARYFRALGVVLCAAAFAGLLSAFVATTRSETSLEVVVAHAGGWGIRSRAWVLGSGATQPLAQGAWPFVERDLRFALGPRTAARNTTGGTRVVLERTPVDLGGFLTLDSVRQPSSLANQSPIDYEPGWILEGSRCRRVPPLSSGSVVTTSSIEPCPPDPGVALAAPSALATGTPWYVARSGETVYVISMESP